VAAGVIAWPDYFRLLGTPILRGREFVDSDGLQGTEAVIVSRQFVARHYAGQDPIGKRLRLFGLDGQARPWMTVIGVVAGFRQQDSSNPVNDSQVFVPYRFESGQGMTVLLRTSGTPSSLAPALRSEVQQLDEDLPLSSVQTLEEMFYRSRWHWRVFGTVFLIFAVVALGMAAVGIYAVMAHATSNRTHEIGIRLALGAGFGSIIRLVLRRGLIQLSLGMGIGLAAALGACQLMAQLLFKVSPRDPLTLTVVAAVLAAVGLVACWMPARRAARLDPFRALRQD
jgi:predicted permease